jgi:hypothetical protein
VKQLENGTNCTVRSSWLTDLIFSIQCTAGMIKSRMKMCVWSVECNGRKMGAGLLLGKLKECDCFEDLGLERRKILRQVFKN